MLNVWASLILGAVYIIPRTQEVMASKVKEDSDSGNMNIILRNPCNNSILFHLPSIRWEATTQDFVKIIYTYEHIIVIVAGAWNNGEHAMSKTLIESRNTPWTWGLMYFWVSPGWSETSKQLYI